MSFVKYVPAFYVLSPFVCVFVSGHHVRGSVTKRRKARLKRLDRRWTLGGMVSRQQSRGDLRQGAHLLIFLHPSSLYPLTPHLSSSPVPVVPCPVFSHI